MRGNFTRPPECSLEETRCIADRRAILCAACRGLGIGLACRAGIPTATGVGMATGIRTATGAGMATGVGMATGTGLGVGAPAANAAAHTASSPGADSGRPSMPGSASPGDIQAPLHGSRPPLQFPRDHGAHPDRRIEWWYLTAWADERTGVQVTIFRARLGRPRRASLGSDQILIGHVAVVREDWPALVHAQTSWRSAEGLTVCAANDMQLQLPGWSMQRGPDDAYRMRVEQGRIALRMLARPPAAPVLQGAAGYSQKGPQAEQFSCYYSRTQMRLEAQIRVDGKDLALEAHGREGLAWFDHEWSDQLLDPAAAGWDWFGLNFDDGSAWMGFQIRDRSGGRLWTSEPDLRIEPIEHWTSPLSGAKYPVGLRIRSRRGVLRLQGLIAAQEIDARASTGNRYWEGAVRVLDPQGRRVGRGYLELTGYDRPMRL